MVEIVVDSVIVAHLMERATHWGEWKGPQRAKECKPRVPQPKPPPPASPYLCVSEVAAFLRVHPSTIYRFIKGGQLRALRVGGDWRINKEQLDRWLNQ